MAVSRREKASDVKYSAAIGTRPPTTDREFELEDVVEDLRDDINSLCDLSATNEAKVGLSTTQTNILTMLRDYAFTFTPAGQRGTPARLTIRHLPTRTNFTIDA